MKKGIGRRLFAASMVAGLGLCPALPASADDPPMEKAPSAANTAPPGAGGASAASAKSTGGAGAGPTKPDLRTPAERLEGSKVNWDDRWPKFRMVEYIGTVVMGITVFAGRAIPPSPGNWRSVSEFDIKARSVFRLGSEGARNTADDASDLVLTLMVNQLFVDSLLVAWWGHDRPTVAYQMAAMDLEALALNGGIQSIVSAVVSRWRPFRETCVGPKLLQTQDCQDNKQYTSFWSGHTSGAFTTAGLMCMHHAYLPLYGGGLREMLTCAGAFAAAATVGYLRMAADQHYMTDVLTGAGIGTAIGLGVPYFLHYRGGATPPPKKKPNDVSFIAAPTPNGVVLAGEF